PAPRTAERPGIPPTRGANLRPGVASGGRGAANQLDHAPDASTEARRASRAFLGTAGAALRTGREPLDVEPNARPPNPFGERQLDDRVNVVSAPTLRQRVVGP